VTRRFFTNFFWGFTAEPQEMFVQDGQVVFRHDPEPGYIEGAEIVNLGGAFLLPAFIDSHCHILPTGLDLAKLHLGACSTPDEVLDAVRERDRELPEGEWLLAVHYDQTKFPDGRHMTREPLDLITSRPTVLRHSNGHAGVANSAALKAAGIEPSTVDPKGGTFVRGESGELTGVLLETALERVMSAAPQPDRNQMLEAILAAGEAMASLGITAATDMMTGSFHLADELWAYQEAAKKGSFSTRHYVQWSAVFGPRGSALSPMEGDDVRIAGIKIFADGAIGSATAAIHGKFQTTGESGQLIYAPDKLKEMVRIADDAGYAIAIHSIGDRSTDLVLDAYEALPNAKRHRIEHAMILSDAQIERIARLGCKVTMQPEFLHRFAHAYRRQLDEATFPRLKRMKSVHEAGIPLALNSDRPIVPGDPWDGIRTAARRPDGFDQSENFDRREGLLSYTQRAAEANGDRYAGRLDPGSPADFCLYEEDPVTEARPKIAALWRSGECRFDRRVSA